jgi:non-heme Fe2+,alpha-ketoglutarate-dependent halogenase
VTSHNTSPHETSLEQFMSGLALSESELQQFKTDGFWGPFNVYEQAEIRRELPKVRAALMKRQTAPYGQSASGTIGNYDRHLDIPFLSTHVCRPQIVERVKSVLGPDLLCWRTEFFVKYPGDEGTDWHQSRNLAIGSGIAPLAAEQRHPVFPEIFLTLSTWTAFTDSTLENGCLQLVPGSQEQVHYDERKPMAWRPESVNAVVKNGVQRGLFGYDTRDIQIDKSWSPDERLARNIEMEAGTAILFWEATMHGSLPNTSKRSTRMAFVARYVPTYVRIYPNMSTLNEYGGTADLAKWRAVLVAGADRYGFNRL